MKVCERIAEGFKAEGVRAVFGMMGASTIGFYQSIHDKGIKLIDVRHEGFGLGMADGWYRATKTVGVCTSTEGPGIAQLSTGLLTAGRAGSAVVVFVGDCATTDHEHVQNMDQHLYARGCEAGFIRLDVPALVDDVVRDAFRRARLELRPVILSVPVDVQNMQVDLDEPYEPLSALMPPPQPMYPSPKLIAQVADILAGSRKPVIVAGRGAIESGAAAAVQSLAKRIGALVSTSLRGKNFLADDEFQVGISGHYGTRTAMQLFEDADCVIAVGAALNRYTTSNGYLYPNARIVQIDVQPHVLVQAGRRADVYVQADARAALEEIDQVLAKRSVQLTGYRTAEVKAQLKHNFDDPAEFPIEPGCVDAREVCRMLEELIPGDIPLATAGGAAGGFTNLLFNKPRPFVLAGHYFGCTGQMLPAAMGACAAIGNKPVLLLEGDAGMMMHLADFDTAVRYNMPVLAIVLNDEALGIEYQMMVARKLDSKLASVPTPNMGAVAIALGARGCLARSVEEVRKAAQEWLANPGPMIIDVRIGRQVLTLSQRRLLYARDE